MPGFVPGIHVLRAVWQGVDGRDEPRPDVVEPLSQALRSNTAECIHSIRKRYYSTNYFALNHSIPALLYT